LTDSFGWIGADEGDQQDYADALRMIGDAFERGLEEANLSETFRNLFK
jgi:hypothetical protein